MTIRVACGTAFLTANETFQCLIRLCLMRLDPRRIAPLSAAMSPMISASKRSRGATRLQHAASWPESEKRQAISDACRSRNVLGVARGILGRFHNHCVFFNRSGTLRLSEESSARQYHAGLQIGRPPLLGGEEIEPVPQTTSGRGPADRNSNR